MIEKILMNTAELYYPKGISASLQYDEYTKTKEFKNLKEKLTNLFDDKDVNIVREELLGELRSNELLKEIVDASLSSFDRCLTFKIEILKEDKLYQLCLSISLLTPYYLVYVLKNSISIDPCRWLTNPIRDERSEIETFYKELEFISRTTEKITFYKKFPMQFANKVLPDLSYANIEIGDFTFLNAFFFDNIKL